VNKPVSLDRINAVFDVYEMQAAGRAVRYSGEPKVRSQTLSLLSGMTSPRRVTTTH
jgi:hypothetical protein